MSTKTTFKRIALVAVAALGLGVLSVAPSQAAIDQNLHAITFAAGGTTAAASISTSETATASVKVSFVGAAAYDSVTVKANIIDAPSGGLGDTLVIARSDSSTSTGITIGNASRDQATASTGVTFGNGTAGATAVGTFAVSLVKPTKAGTYTIRVTDAPMSAGAASSWGTAITPLTFTVTVAAVDTKAAANSTAYLRADETTYANGIASTDSTVVTSKVSATSTTDLTAEATIWVTEANATSTASESLTVSVTGNAFVTSANGTRPTAGTAITAAYAGANTPIYIWSNGSAGTATVSVSTISGVSLGSKTVKFYGSVTALAADTDPKPRTIVRAGGKTLTGAWEVKATDAAGMPVKGLTLSCVSSAPLVIASCAFTDNADGSYSMDLTSASGSVSGQTSDITVRVVDPAVTTSTAYLSATAVKVTTGGSVNAVTITTDKTSYSAGEQMIVTVKATDSLGNPVYDGAALAALSSNKSVTGLSNVATAFAAGTADSISRDTDGTVLSTYRVFAPASGGSFDIYLDYTNAALATVRATTSATVTDGAAAAADAATDAANEATDAANAATDAALAAADAADAATAAAQDASDAVAALSAEVAKLIASLKAQLTSLTNLVIKIQKKVKA